MVCSFTLTLFRHGLTLENEKRQYLGWSDTPLSSNGLRQTKKVAKELADFVPNQLVSSDLIRCQETTELLFPNQSFSTMSELREMHFGEFELKTYEELKNKQAYRDWLDHPFDKSPTGGESFDEFSKRVVKGLEKIIESLEDSDQDLTLVVHGGVIRLLLSEFVQSDRHFFDWEVSNSQGFQLKWESKESFRRLEKCTSLSVVPSMEKVIG